MKTSLGLARILIARVCNDVCKLLWKKNDDYGNSALEPLRIFSQANSIEQIKVRMDDKLSRIANGASAGEDPYQDLLGYLVLFEVRKRLDVIEQKGSPPVAYADQDDETFEIQTQSLAIAAELIVEWCRKAQSNDYNFTLDGQHWKINCGPVSKKPTEDPKVKDRMPDLKFDKYGNRPKPLHQT